MANLQWNKAFALEQTAGDEELLDELLVLFKESSASDLKQLQHAVEQEDISGVIHAAHSLKGASASLGIEGVRQLALAIEDDARANSIAVARDKLTALEALLQEVQEL
jgi:HPt (histidine-containing phosphotransfer) domain-containing protein